MTDRKSPIHRDRICRALDVTLPARGTQPDYYLDLFVEYWSSNFSSSHLLEELETHDEGKLWSYTWEALLFRWLVENNIKLIPTNSRGPDFCIPYENRKIWIEATTPSPEGIPAEYLNLDPGIAKRKPDTERVLRCTSAISDKQKKFSAYLQKGIIEPSDITIIAINICRLSYWDIDGNGVSQLPLALEALFPLGPIAVPITSNGELAGPAQNTVRWEIQKREDLQISTAGFLNETFGNISLVLQSHQRDAYEKKLILSAIHNPHAVNQLSPSSFSFHKEYIAKKADGIFTILDVG